MKEKLKDRFVILAFFFLLFGFVIVLQLINLQIINGKEYADASQRNLLQYNSILAPRGKILDRNGIPVADNSMGFIVQITRAKSDVDLNDMLLKLANIFEKNNDSYNKRLSKILTVNPLDFGSKIPVSDKEPDIKKRQQSIENVLKNDIVGAVSVKSSDIKLLVNLQKEYDPQTLYDFLHKKYKISGSYTNDEAYKIMTLRYELSIGGYNNTVSKIISLAKDVSKETVMEIEERHREFPGITTDIEPMRRYIDGQLAAHVIGYVRGISAAQLKDPDFQGYEANDIVGKEGIEDSAEKFLRGVDGEKMLEVDTQGRTMRELSKVPPVPGNDVTLTLDMKLQKVAMESLQKHIQDIRVKGGKNNYGDANAGSAVAIDVNSGEILAMANYPSYNPSWFLADASNKEAQKALSDLSNDPNSSSLNRAIMSSYAPGSTFKPITAIAGLEGGAITPDSSRIRDKGFVHFDRNVPFYCLEYRNKSRPNGHGNQTLSEALATSCNVYFGLLGNRPQVGIDSLEKWAKLFGLGTKTGIDIIGESSGTIASKKVKADERPGEGPWGELDTANASIGQSFNAFTPLQLANYIATIANGGKNYKPHLIKMVKEYDGKVVREDTPTYTRLPLHQDYLKAVRDGMEQVMTSSEGTAAEAFKGFPFKGGGKTGTAETGQAGHSSNALFVCYAPADNPRIAVAVVVERGAWGSYTAPIARDILTEYFKLNQDAVNDDVIKQDIVSFTR